MTTPKEKAQTLLDESRMLILGGQARLLLLAMASLAPALGAATCIVFERATESRAVGLSAGIGVVVLFYGLWFVWPTMLKVAHDQPD